MAKFCTNCGNTLGDNDNVCSSCGTPVNGNTTQPVNNPGAVNPQAKSKVAAGILGLLLGAWGIHNFYLGFTNKGIIQIVVTIFTCGIGGLWGFIEGIMILTGSIHTDANGNELTN